MVQVTARKEGPLNRSHFFLRPGAASMIQIDELMGRGNMTDDVETANGFLLGGAEGQARGWKVFSAEWILRPLSGGHQVFKRVWVFDQDLHKELS